MYTQGKKDFATSKIKAKALFEVVTYAQVGYFRESLSH